jgi:hypothetical protein
MDQVKKKVEGGFGNSLLTDLKMKRKINPGFSSNAPRFTEFIQQEASCSSLKYIEKPKLLELGS